MNSYLNIIKTSFFLFPFLALLITLPYFLIQYRKYGSVSKLRIIIIYTFILYLLNAYFLVILPLPSFEEVSKLITPRMQLMPFDFVKNIIQNSGFSIFELSTYIKLLKTPAFYQVGFNLLLFIPFGMYSRYYFKNDFKKTLLLSFGLSLFFEITQLSGLYGIYVRGYRLFDVDDLIINTLGGIVGYFLIKPLLKALPSRDKIDEKAYEKGNHISTLRRLFAISIDYFIYFILVFILYSFIDSKVTSLLIVMLLYFVLVPFFTKGYTIGKKILRIRIVGIDKINILNYLIRYFILFSTVIFVPYYLEIAIKVLTNMNYNPIKVKFLISCMSLLYLMVYTLIFIINTHNEKPMIYEKISKTKQVSSVNKKNN